MDNGRSLAKGWEDRLLYPADSNAYPNNSIYKEQNYKACYGMLQLDKKSSNRLEDACKRAANNVRISFTTIKNILKNSFGKQAILFDNTTLPAHDNM